jgi:hypothetical protein
MTLELFRRKRKLTETGAVPTQEEQLNRIERLVEEVELANNLNVLPDYILRLKIVKRRLEP